MKFGSSFPNTIDKPGKARLFLVNPLILLDIALSAMDEHSSQSAFLLCQKNDILVSRSAHYYRDTLENMFFDI